MTGTSDRSTAMTCPQCAEPAPPEAAVCDWCGYVLRRPKPLADRLAEAASLAMVLIVIVLVCRLIGRALGL